LTHDFIVTAEDQAGSVGVLGNDRSSEGALRLVGVTTPAHGSVTWTPAGTVTYRPATGFVGNDQIGYSAADAAGRTTTDGLVRVRVCNVGPTAQAVTLHTTLNHPVGFNPLAHATAPAGDKISLWSVTQPAHGQAGTFGGLLYYVPAKGFTGTDTFTYTVSDGQQACSTAPVTVVIPKVPIEVSPIPPIRRSPVRPTLPHTGLDVGWLALIGALLVLSGGAALFGSSRLVRARSGGPSPAPTTAAAVACQLARPLPARRYASGPTGTRDSRRRHPPARSRRYATRRSSTAWSTSRPPPRRARAPARRPGSALGARQRGRHRHIPR
jgi:LPXTG-motif cell wall-anchored protein